MNVVEYMVEPSAEIESERLLELFGSELKSLEWRNPRSGEDLEEVGNCMISEESSYVSQRVRW